MQEAERHYRGAAGRRYHQQKRAIPDAALPWVAALRAQKFSPHIRESDTVFEYGVGAGWNLAALKCKRKMGFDVADFLEPSVRALGIEFVADTKTIPDATMDAAICHHTLEHVLQPVVVLEEIKRLLRPGGKLLLYVPREQEPRYDSFDSAEPNHHLYSWNAQTLGNLVEEAGFHVREANIGRFGYDRVAAVWADKLKLGETGFRVFRCLAHLIRPGYEIRIMAHK